jgi:hypothetical protein
LVPKNQSFGFGSGSGSVFDGPLDPDPGGLKKFKRQEKSQNLTLFSLNANIYFFFIEFIFVFKRTILPGSGYAFIFKAGPGSAFT